VAADHKRGKCNAGRARLGFGNAADAGCVRQGLVPLS
jgi:hypothetical protein